MIIGINASFARRGNTGIGQVTLNFLKNLAINPAAREFEFVLYLEEDFAEEIHFPENFQKRIFLPWWKRDDLIRKFWWENFSLPGRAKADGCDVFISLYQSTTITAVDTKHLMVVHDIIPKLFPEYLNNWRKKVLWGFTETAIRSVDKIITVSRQTEQDIVEHMDIKAYHITTAYTDVDEIYKHEPSENIQHKVLQKYDLTPGYIYYGGGLEMRKNVERVIRAYKFLLEKNKKEHFVHEFPRLVVSGKLMPQLAPLITDVETLVRELNLTEHVSILGMVPQADLPTLYRNAKVFVYPSLYEGFGLPILEAMNQGTPVVTSKVSSLPEIGGDSVLYCDPEDVRDIAMTVKNVLVNEHLQEVLARRGKERAHSFSWDRFTEKILNIAKEK
jgi:glycosyltransferase involved in cell wall biosynthesis